MVLIEIHTISPRTLAEGKNYSSSMNRADAS